MVHIERSALVMHSAERMHALVANVLAYPEFLPWCHATSVRHIGPNEIEATIAIAFRGMRQQFTTRNRIRADLSIELQLVDGPFKSLDGRWTFTPLQAEASKVSLVLDYQLASGLIEHVVGPMFSYIAGTLVDAFVRRANGHGTKVNDAS